jgi:hypothetical protein
MASGPSRALGEEVVNIRKNKAPDAVHFMAI